MQITLGNLNNLVAKERSTRSTRQTIENSRIHKNSGIFTEFPTSYYPFNFFEIKNWDGETFSNN